MIAKKHRLVRFQGLIGVKKNLKIQNNVHKMLLWEHGLLVLENSDKLAFEVWVRAE